MDKSGNMTIHELAGYHFVVAAYQRGYKWTVQEVFDLIGDISAFEPSSDALFYYLQPLALVELDKPKKRYEVIDGQQRLTTQPLALVELDKSEKRYEVIDGQQRLTTCHIALSLLDSPLYTMEYNTRPTSTEFLETVANPESKMDLSTVPLESDTITAFETSIGPLWSKYPKKPGHDNTDNYHFFMAAQTLLCWRRDHPSQVASFLTNLKNHTRFIWYVELREQDKRTVFRNLNSGKIPLTNAELLKAYFINKPEPKNACKRSDAEKESLRQNKLATEWDLIERNLHHDKFWFFINNSRDTEKYETRIDFLFELLLGDKNEAEHRKDSRLLYRQFSQDPKRDWESVRSAHDRLWEWFEDNDFYHLIGYIVAQKIKKIHELFNLAKDFKKSDFKTELKKIIKDDLGKLVKNDPETPFLEMLHYGENDATILKVLLLYNIELYRRSNADGRFPFDKFKNQQWSLEHIHAQNSKEFETMGELKDWLEDIGQLKETFGEVSEKFPAAEFEAIRKVIENLARDEKIPQELKPKIAKVDKELISFFDMHAISNLALLDSSTNSSFSNSSFQVKREKMIAIDKEQWVKSTNEKAFIPIGTKNVFLKYTSQSIQQLTVWGANDRLYYYDHIEEILGDFLPSEVSNA